MGPKGILFRARDFLAFLQCVCVCVSWQQLGVLVPHSLPRAVLLAARTLFASTLLVRPPLTGPARKIISVLGKRKGPRKGGKGGGGPKERGAEHF